MKKKHISHLLLLTAIMVFSLVGCQSSENAAENDTDAAATETPAEETEAPDAAEEGSKDTSEATRPEDEVTDQTPLEEIQGEGMPDNTLPDMSGIESVSVGENCVFSSESGADLCSLKIDSIKFTDERNAEDSSNPEAVVIVDYTYENTSSEDSLLLDGMSFKLIENDTVCTPYYLSTLTPAEPANKGETQSGQLAFAVTKTTNDVTLFFDSEALNAQMAFKAALE